MVKILKIPNMTNHYGAAKRNLDKVYELRREVADAYADPCFPENRDEINRLNNSLRTTGKVVEMHGLLAIAQGLQDLHNLLDSLLPRPVIPVHAPTPEPVRRLLAEIHQEIVDPRDSL